MRRFSQLRFSGAVLSPRTRPSCPQLRRIPVFTSRLQSTAAAEVEDLTVGETDSYITPTHTAVLQAREAFKHLPSPPPQSAASSAKLAALHARLNLSPRLPVETLGRCLIDPSADPHPSFNNTSLSLLGRDVLGYHTSEHILCTYPRLPTVVIFAAMTAYVGPDTLASLSREWGIEVAAAPGGEVDPGLLQYLPTEAGNADPTGMGILNKEAIDEESEAKRARPWNRGLTSKTTLDNYFGDFAGGKNPWDYPGNDGTSLENIRDKLKTGVHFKDAASGFVQALFGALYLHGGRSAAKAFFNSHIANRKLDISSLFEFKQPSRDLSRLCAREGFEGPVARILSETGRKSRTPVFVVGVFSGRDKLGEGTGASLDEARTRAAINALKGWYLYSPLKKRVPSDVEGGGKEWEPVYIDGGEVIV